MLFIVWGLLTTVVGLSTLALGVAAVAIITSANRGTSVAAGLAAVVFTTLAVIAILWGAAHIVVGLPLRRRKTWARIMALVLGSIDLVLPPYGTALGIYALWVLLSEKGRELFATHAGA